MRNLLARYKITAGLVIVALLAGCIVSGTFIIIEPITFEADEDFYFYRLDITDDATWEDHKDDIQFIETVGAEFYISSSETEDVTFSCYVDEYDAGGLSPISVPATATAIIEDYTVSPGTTKISYLTSLKIIKNIDRLKALTFKGKFDCFAEVSENTGSTFAIDSAKVIVTLGAGK